MPERPYCLHPITYSRRKTRVVMVGEVGIGGNNPIRVQSMTVADTMDTVATVCQIVQLYEAGCEIVRVTVPSLREAENLREICAALRQQRVRVPLVADIHYTPHAALKAVEYVEKVRINPGNYADKKRFEQKEYSDQAYQEELERMAQRFAPLVRKAKEYGVALRIGTNHGSLSDRILNRFGDTPAGMVESALEFVHVCESLGFHDIVLSMKASNPKVTIQANRLLVARLDELGMPYPIHLGVTEAGDGEDGRIKSAIGIGSLLEDGIGDTIRVSLTEDPVKEVPVAYALVKKYNDRLSAQAQIPERPSSGPQVEEPPAMEVGWDPYRYGRRSSRALRVGGFTLGASAPVRVELAPQTPLSEEDALLAEIAQLAPPEAPDRPTCEILQLPLTALADVDRLRRLRQRLWPGSPAIAAEVCNDVELACQAIPYIDKLNFIPRPYVDGRAWEGELVGLVVAAKEQGVPLQWTIASDQTPGHILHAHGQHGWQSLQWMCTFAQRLIAFSGAQGMEQLMLALQTPATISAYRLLAATLQAGGKDCVLLLRHAPLAQHEDPLLQASIALGSLLCDGIGDAIELAGDLPSADRLRLSYSLLQGAGVRSSRTDFISCPSCGRTLFDLQTTTERIKSKMSHLKGVKIAIMGCIVNGPGEMADADFGYVGSGQQRVNLYVGKECVERGIPEALADERLIHLIKEHGRWVDPPV